MRKNIFVFWYIFLFISGPGALAAKYIGGEHRHDTAGGHAYVAIAGDCAASSLKEIIAGHLLQKVLGNINLPTIERCSYNDTNWTQ